MRIAVSSTSCNGKSYFIKSFLNRWKMYKTPEKTYRDLIDEDELSLNQEGTAESQRIIRDALSDQAIENSKEDFCIHDRCILDNLAYTLWLAEKKKIDDDDFIAASFHIARETLKFYDIVFFLPMSPLSPVVLEEKETRDLDATYRTEINNIFLGMQSNYSETSGLIFPIKDSPALIEIVGDEKHKEKTDLVANYITEEGVFNTTDESVLKTISEISQEDATAQALLDQVRI